MLVIFPCLTLDDWITGSSVNLSHEQFRRETPPIGTANGSFLRGREVSLSLITCRKPGILGTSAFYVSKIFWGKAFFYHLT